jgi:hypothetical protein
MSIRPPIRPEDRSRSAERQVLEELQEALREDRAVSRRFQQMLRHLKEVFNDAANPEDHTGRRARLVEWYGQEKAEKLIEYFDAFLTAYWNRSKDAKEFIPFPDFFDLLQVPKETVSPIVDQLLETIRARQQGFPLWPPPRQGSCFRG